MEPNKSALIDLLDRANQSVTRETRRSRRLQGRVDALQAELDEMVDLVKPNGVIRKLKGRIKDLEKQMVLDDARLVAQGDVMGDLNARYSDQVNTCEALQGRVVALQGDVARLEREVDRLQAQRVGP